ncbi:MAG: phage N-6-adenine-methyltransferase [Candidatus Bathyarchaeota archaeon]|nr:phage N-6-adenine-methyltransferase [Candidatus Bathyarchaeota archaeon]
MTGQIMLHQRIRSLASSSDEWETPDEVYDELCERFNIRPVLDVCTTRKMSKCKKFFTKDATSKNWTESVWCNPPHSRTKDFVLKAEAEWFRNNIDIMMLVPANSVCAGYFDKILDEGHATYHRLSGRIRFLVDGKPSEYPSRNAYFVVIWRRCE